MHEQVESSSREQRLNELADAIAAQGRRRPVVLGLDLTRRDAADRIGETLSAGGIISITPVVLLFALMQRSMVRGLTAGATK